MAHINASGEGLTKYLLSQTIAAVKAGKSYTMSGFTTRELGQWLFDPDRAPLVESKE